MNKKQMILAALLTVLAIGVTHAQTFYPALKGYSAEAKAQLDKTYAGLLNTKDSKYIENALATVTMIRLDLPSDEFPMIKDKVEYISTHSDSPAVRYKASLAKTVFANVARFKEEAVLQYATTDEFFNAIAQKAGIASVNSNAAHQ